MAAKTEMSGIIIKNNIVLIDLPGIDGYSHMVSNDVEFLHIFAEQIGVKRCWFQNKKNKKTGKSKNQPHYDVKSNKFETAINNGAILVESKIIVEFLKEHYE